jgi:hypothetical protein
VQAVPEALADLERWGIPRVPALVLGDRAVHGWNPAGYAALLGVAWAPASTLGPAELAARLDTILEAAQALLARLDARQLDWVPPERERTVRDLGYHVFRLALGCVDGIDRGAFPDAWLGETAPPDFVGGGDLARWGALVRGRLAGWFEGAGPEDYARTVQVYYGPQSGHELLERTTWHAAQHLRQLYDVAARLGVTPPRPLPVETFAGLPLPDALW